MAHTQDNRLIALETPLGKDALLLREFTGSEAISRLPQFELDLLSSDPEIKFEDILGKRVTVSLQLGDDKTRYFNGFVSRFIQVGGDVGLANYRATMVPWLWFLTRTTDCRIFQHKSIPDIIQQIFKDLGFTDFRVSLKGTYEPRDYCVQYRETDFNFVSRLMEQYGIFYYFEHAKAKHTLVLGDDVSVHQPCPHQKDVRWEPHGSAALSEDVITTVNREQEIRSGRWSNADYNFEMPSTSLYTSLQTTINAGGNAPYDVYDYPGEYETKKQGEYLARIRMEEEEALHLKIVGHSTVRAFMPGHIFDLKGYLRKDMNSAYLLTEVQHRASVGDTYTTGKTDGSADYTNTFLAIPKKVPYRPARVTAIPLIPGTQTARVVGVAGEIIWCDKYGRVKVQFFWDREGKWNEKSSCWIRTSQNWGGKGWGGVFVPHIGQEVIISFLEGNPDRPLLTGRLYNAEVMPPLNLPADATKSAIQDHGGNSLIMEGNGGKQQIVISSPTSGTTIRFGSR